MTERCASCHYPLSVLDSVVCLECTSYFHIDCAQLVGFILFELSAEPAKNTFRCTTCQLLPLPIPRDDSDFSDDEGMPSRQLDYALEGDSDLGKDMNEVKGSIQDLSDLCKDMLREINDLKSINLTLRCCIENLRHDNEQRDSAIVELRRRLDLLQGKYFEGKTNESTNWNLDRNEDVPELFGNSNEISESLIKNISYDHKNVNTVELEDIHKQDNETSPKLESGRYETDESSFWADKEDDTQKDEWFSENIQHNDSKLGDTDHESGNEKEIQLGKSINEVNEVVKVEIISETNANRQDWSWKGSEAVEADNKDDVSEEEEEEESEEESDDKEIPRWKLLKEEIETVTKQEAKNLELSVDDIGSNKDENSEERDEEEQEEAKRVRKSVRWDDNINEDESETETDFSQKESEYKHEDQSEIEEENLTQADVSVEGDLATDDEDRLETDEEAFRIESALEEESQLEADEVILEVQPSLDPRDGLGDSESRLEVDEAVTEGYPHLEGDEGVDRETRLKGGIDVDGELRLEGEVREDEELRLEGEVREDEELRLEGEVREDGALRLEGELREDGEFRLEGTDLTKEGDPQLPESPSPVHTEEDLWLYLKDTVSSVRPATVEEFVQNLIGTLQHVPEEFLKPVIDANIRRANSPSTTDGEHLTTPESTRPQEGNVLEKDCYAENQEQTFANPLEAKDSTTIREESTAPTKEVPSGFLGFSSALEATD